VSLELQLLVLALEAALYPTLLAAVIVLLAQPQAKRLLATYLGAGLLVSIGAGCLIVYGLGHSGTLDSSGATLSWTGDLAIGGLALLAAVALAVRADARFAEGRRARRRGRRTRAEVETASKEPWSERMLAHGSAPLVFLAGLAVNLPGAVYLVALKDIAAAQLSAPHAFALILGFNAIMFLLAEVPLAGLIFAPERTAARVRRFNAWFSANGRTIAIALCATLGLFLIVRGLVRS
jgi:hypothetical protein